MPDDNKKNIDGPLNGSSEPSGEQSKIVLAEPSSNRIEDILRKKYGGPIARTEESIPEEKVGDSEENVIKLRRIIEPEVKPITPLETPLVLATRDAPAQTTTPEIKQKVPVPLEPTDPPVGDPASNGIKKSKETKPFGVDGRKLESIKKEEISISNETKIQPKKSDKQIPKFKIPKFATYTLLVKSVLLGLGVISLIVVIGFIGPKVFTSFSIFGTPQELSAEEVVEKVGKLVELPKGEEPTIATVTDLAPLQGQEFFKEAKVGDKVLIYSTSGKAILYRPSDNKIIVIAPINK